MATDLVCTECDTALVIHCANALCSWYRCATARCTAFIYDINQGILLRANGTREQLGETTGEAE